MKKGGFITSDPKPIGRRKMFRLLISFVIIVVLIRGCLGVYRDAQERDIRALTEYQIDQIEKLSKSVIGEQKSDNPTKEEMGEIFFEFKKKHPEKAAQLAQDLYDKLNPTIPENELTYFIDKDNGCYYVSVSGVGVSPRYKTDGTMWCGSVETVEESDYDWDN